MNLLRALGILPPRENNRPATVSLNQPIEIGIPHCCFYCHRCRSQILLPHNELGYAFGMPSIRKIETRCIGTVCLKCYRVGPYSMFRGCPGYDTRHRFVSSRPIGKTTLLDWMACAEKSCIFSLPFFVTLDGQFSKENMRAQAGQWLWGDLTCSAGHIIQSPQWLRPAASYRGASNLNRAAGSRLR